MSIQYAENVLKTLARHLGVPAHEISSSHDLYRDWGLTPLSLVVVLLDLERTVAVELPAQDLCTVRTVADLITRFRGWVHDSDALHAASAAPRARRSKSALSERRLRSELHHLRWLERQAQLKSNVRAIQSDGARADGAARRVASR
jgi:acyl carrier protein